MSRYAGGLWNYTRFFRLPDMVPLSGHNSVSISEGSSSCLMDNSSPAWEQGGLRLQVNAVEPFSSYWLMVTSEPAGE